MGHYAVNHDKRGVLAIEVFAYGVDATYGDVADFARTAAVGDVHTGRLALQGLDDIVGRSLGECLGVDGHHGARDIRLLHGAVADHYGLFKHL